MKRFFIKTCFFVLPFLFSYFFMFFGASNSKGDLLRVGYLIDNTSDYRNIFTDSIPDSIYYTNLSELSNQTKFDILTIGDSFSQQEYGGYQNYLAKNNIKVLHVDLLVNSLQMTYYLINGGFFDKVDFDYVIIQSIERYIIERSQNLNKTISLSLEEYNINRVNHQRPTIKYKLFSQSVLKFPFYNLLYLFDDNAYFSKVYKVKSKDNLFSISNNNILFFHEDLENAYLGNKTNVNQLNKELNSIAEKLSSFGIKLIVLPSPDKYDIYYKYIINNSKYPKPVFFENLKLCQNNYIYIDTKEMLSNALKNKKDIYFYDDTHWSPFASQIIAKELYNKIR